MDHLGPKSKVLIFLSHSHADAELAVTIAGKIENTLEEAGYMVEVFNTSNDVYRFDPTQDASESELWNYLNENLQTANYYIQLLTPGSVKRNMSYIYKELNAARNRLLRLHTDYEFLIPIMVSDVDQSKVPSELMELQPIVVDSGEGIQRIAQRIILSEEKIKELGYL